MSTGKKKPDVVKVNSIEKGLSEETLEAATDLSYLDQKKTEEKLIK